MKNISRHHVGNSGNPMKLLMVLLAGLFVLYFIWVSRNIPKAGLVNMEQQANVRIEETPTPFIPIIKSPSIEKHNWTRKPGRRYVWIVIVLSIFPYFCFYMFGNTLSIYQYCSLLSAFWSLDSIIIPVLYCIRFISLIWISFEFD